VEDFMSAFSIILPTYNRARFLPQAFEAIKGQQFQDWELIVIDDGSTDITRELVADLGRGWTQPVRYVYQENQGAYAARNRGLDLADGASIAFFDSDDVWLPHHLDNCVNTLEANPHVDWVYGATRRVEDETGRVLTPHSFYVDGRPRPFLGLRARASGRARIIDDPRAVACAIEHGLYCGLQNSVIRRRVFETLRFQTGFRNESEDQIFVIRALAAGFRFAYLEDIHLLYSVHAQNSSASARGLQLRKHISLLEDLVRGYEDLGERLRLTPPERRALGRRLGGEYFWCLGYSVLLRNGLIRQAMEAMRRGISKDRFNIKFWKTYFLTMLRYSLPVKLG
jgi:glycosyltransferase involved in cell wall biosynthesis